MAIIQIKGRDMPIIISNNIAREIKSNWLGDDVNGIKKAGKTDVVDLGEWAGEYSKISSIEIVEEPKEEKHIIENVNEEFSKLSPEEKAKSYERFKTYYWMKFHKYPDIKILHQVYQIQLEYFKTHPIDVFIPNEAFNELLK